MHAFVGEAERLVSSEQRLEAAWIVPLISAFDLNYRSARVTVEDTVVCTEHEGVAAGV